MDFDSESAVGLISLISVSVSVAAAVAAAFSAAIAYQANRNLAEADRKRRVREVSLLAHRVDAAARDIDELGTQLTLAYEALFSFAGQGAGSSRLAYTRAKSRKSETLSRPCSKQLDTCLKTARRS